jgi:hypothetical protein
MENKMKEEQLQSFLKDEYFFLQGAYEEFDGRALTIKSWAITICGGAYALAFERKAPILWVFGAIAALLFWLLEAMWKSFQYTHAARIQEIEKHFRGEHSANPIFPLQASSSWFREWRRSKAVGKLARVAAIFVVYVPHVFLFAGGLLLLLIHFGIKPLF